MQYSQVQTGRTFYLRVDNNDDLVRSISELCLRERISSAWFQAFGALASGSLVVGPVREEIPPEKVVRTINGVHELLGVGSVMPDAGGEPSVHLHTALGRGSETLAGCLKGDTRVFLVQEVLLVEIAGGMVRRDRDGVSLPHFEGLREEGAGGLKNSQE